VLTANESLPVAPADDGGEPRVTVFVPTYNRARWLGESIESVLAQTYRDFRLVVSDNASTDATAEVVRQFDDPRISYVRLDEHLDLNAHFNRCYELAGGDYVFLIPDDDRMTPDALERTVRCLDAHPTVGLVHGRAKLVGEEGETIAAAHDMTGLPGTQVESGDDFIRRSVEAGYRVHASTALIRTSALASVRLRDEDFPVTDVGLWMRMALTWDIAFLAETLAVVRIHGGAYTADGRGVTAGGYVQRVGVVEKLREVKLRFLDEEGSRFPDADDLRRTARAAMRRDLLDLAGHQTIPERRLVPTARTVARLSKYDRTLLREVRTWRLLGASVLGRRVAGLIKPSKASQGHAGTEGHPPALASRHGVRGGTR
jgi:glycosyltransferase involved in cell wall biosynthesis